MPSVFIVGAQKGGTTDLFASLRTSRNITHTNIKEFHFFDAVILGYKPVSLEMYRSECPVKANENDESQMQVVIDATPAYLFIPFVPEMIAVATPPATAKIIIALREPVGRAWSGYFESLYHLLKAAENVTAQVANKGFSKEIQAQIAIFRKCVDESMLMEKSSLSSHKHHKHMHVYNDCFIPSLVKRKAAFLQHAEIPRSLYFYHVLNYYNVFERSQILIIRSEDYFANRSTQITRVCDFLHITKPLLTPVKAVHARDYPELDVNTKQSLRSFFHPYNLLLYQFLTEKSVPFLPWD